MTNKKSTARKAGLTTPDTGFDSNGLWMTPCTCHMLRRTARRVSRFYDQALKPSGLKLSQYSVLAYTSKAGSLNVTELAAMLDVERTTLTRNLRPLVQSGWVRISEGDSKRSRSVSLTAAGQKVLENTFPLWQKAERDFRDQMGRQDIGELHHLLNDAAVAAAGPGAEGAAADQ